MLFNSFEFVIFLIVVFFLYYSPLLKKQQIYILVAGSFFFYSYQEPILLLLLITSIIINVLTSYYVTYGKPENRKLYAVSGVVFNLLILSFFKYGPLLGKTFFNTDSSIGELLIKMPLPIGISFYTFEGISLLVDSFKEKEGSQTGLTIDPGIRRHFLNTSLFVSFFPHLVAGPIVKAHDFLPQVKTKLFSEINWQYVFRTITVGYFLKLVIADNIKDFTAYMSYPEAVVSQSSITLIIMLYGYSVQIFSDFAGYSLIALGLAALFGYRLSINFKFPYISRSFSEFWTRWHISLSSFLKEYLYIPLGGNRKGNVRTYINLMVVMFLGGLWHGAAWSYAVWGTFHGLALAVERIIQHVVKVRTSGFTNFFKMFLVFSFVTLAWLLFKLPDFSQVIVYLKSITKNWSYDTDRLIIINIVLHSIPVFLYHLYYLYRTKASHNKWARYEYLAFGVMLFMIILNSGTGQEFIYFQF